MHVHILHTAWLSVYFIFSFLFLCFLNSMNVYYLGQMWISHHHFHAAHIIYLLVLVGRPVPTTTKEHRMQHKEDIGVTTELQYIKCCFYLLIYFCDFSVFLSVVVESFLNQNFNTRLKQTNKHQKTIIAKKNKNPSTVIEQLMFSYFILFL